MARAKPAKPPAGKAKTPKARAPARSKGGSGGSMFKLLFNLAILGGLGYAAYTVPYHGQTMFDRAVHYVEHEMDAHHRAAQKEEAPATTHKPQETVADRRPTRTTPHAPAERITQSDKDALDRLIPH